MEKCDLCGKEGRTIKYKLGYKHSRLEIFWIKLKLIFIKLIEKWKQKN